MPSPTQNEPRVREKTRMPPTQTQPKPTSTSMSSTVSTKTKPSPSAAVVLAKQASHQQDDSQALSVATTGRVARKESHKDIVTIVVSTLDKHKLKRDSLPSNKKWFSRSSTSELHFTDSSALQDTIDALALSPKRRTLNILASGEVTDIAFDVPSHFTTLKVLRCVPAGEKGELHIDGSSTYHNVALEKWQAHHHRRHTLMIGHERGVRIRVASLSKLPSWSRTVTDLSDEDKSELLTNFQKMAEKRSVDDVNALIASILKILVGTDKFGLSFRAAAGGIYAKFAFGIHAIEIGAAGAKLATIATAAGSAVVLGMAAGAAIYFIPWDSVFDWFKTALGWLWDKVKLIWDMFTGWVMSYFTGSSAEKEEAEKKERRKEGNKVPGEGKRDLEMKSKRR